MSHNAIKTALEQAISVKNAQVICVSGAWGTGKTHTWKEIIQETKDKNTSSLPRSKYAYISLFGAKDTNDILQNISINTEKLLNDKTTSSLKKVAPTKNINKAAKIAAQLISDHQNFIPYVSSLGSLVSSIISLSVKDMIICIDDIERRNKNISIVDVMGIANYLRETRNCVVVILLNEDSLSPDDRDCFFQYSEKTIDIKMIFKQEPKKAADIVFNEEDTTSKILHKASIDLGITNIRVLKKAKYYAKKLHPLTIDMKNEKLIEKIFRSLLLFCWSVLSHGNKDVPTIEYMENYQKIYFQ